MCDLRNRLEESHKDLHQWFLLHQECLLLQNNENEYAQQAFSVFADFLQQHLQFENAVLLPVLHHADLRWGIHVYAKEHEKMQKMLRDVETLLQHFCRLQGREKRLALLDMLDKEQSFYHLMEHHEQREEQDLFLHLEKLESSAIRQWLLVEEALHKRHDSFKQHLKQFLENA